VHEQARHAPRGSPARPRRGPGSRRPAGRARGGPVPFR
jgi:hypothetical protein